MDLPLALDPALWRARAAAHEAAVDARLAGHLERRRRGGAHPVEDFLFTYYRLRPSALRRWHPGVGLALVDAPVEGRWTAAVRARTAEGDDVPATGLDVEAFRRDRAPGLRHVALLLTRTAGRAPRLGCFGLHEWAMVYGLPEGARRHEALPLRLGARGTDDVVEAHRITCTHHDAFRFFTEDAAPRNTLSPTRATQPDDEQPGCLHAGMDLYRFAGQLGPAAPSELLLDCFDLAREIRVLDMQASPYDLADLGHEPVRIETPSGKAEYARRQAVFAGRGQVLRARLLEVLAALGVHAPPGQVSRP